MVAVGGLLIEDEKLLLVKRKQRPSRGSWTLPGGRVRWGERLVDAVVREFREETSLIVEPIQLAGIFEWLPTEGDGEHHYVIVDYWVKRRSGTPKAGSDADDLGWFPISNLPFAQMPRRSADFIRRLVEVAGTREPG